MRNPAKPALEPMTLAGVHSWGVAAVAGVVVHIPGAVCLNPGSL